MHPRRGHFESNLNQPSSVVCVRFSKTHCPCSNRDVSRETFLSSLLLLPYRLISKPLSLSLTPFLLSLTKKIFDSRGISSIFVELSSILSSPLSSILRAFPIGFGKITPVCQSVFRRVAFLRFSFPSRNSSVPFNRSRVMNKFFEFRERFGTLRVRHRIYLRASMYRAATLMRNYNVIPGNCSTRVYYNDPIEIRNTREWNVISL